MSRLLPQSKKWHNHVFVVLKHKKKENKKSEVRKKCRENKRSTSAAAVVEATNESFFFSTCEVSVSTVVKSLRGACHFLKSLPRMKRSSCTYNTRVLTFTRGFCTLFLNISNVIDQRYRFEKKEQWSYQGIEYRRAGSRMFQMNTHPLSSKSLEHFLLLLFSFY